jgi:hypothetical protein
VAALERLNIPLSPQEMMSPQQIAAADPKVQMQALQQAMQNPQIVQAMLEQMHKSRQLAFDQEQTLQQQAQQPQGAPPDVGTGPPAPNQGAQTIPSQGF